MNKDIIKKDFYKAVNGEWFKKARIASDKSATGGFYELDRDLERQVRKLASKWIKTPSLVSDPILQEFVKFYKMTKDFTKREQMASKPLEKYLIKIESLKSWQDICNNYSELINKGFTVPIDFGTTQDFVDNTKVILAMDSPRLILPEKSYYEDKPLRDNFLTIYRNMYVKLFKLIGKSASEANKIIDKALKFDKSMIEMTKSAEEKADYVKSYNVFTLDEINSKSIIFDVKNIAYQLVNQHIDTVVVMNPRFIDAINTLYTNETFENFKAKMLLDFIRKAAPFLTEEMRIVSGEFGRAFSGAKIAISKQKAAFKLAESYFSMPFGVEFAKEVFGAEAKKNVENMVTKMIGIYKERLSANEWLSKKTIDKAITKLNALRMMIGYPEEFEPYYNQLKVTPYSQGGSVLDNIIEFSDVISRYHFSEYMQPVNDNYWEMTPAMVNAYFHPTKNVIVFPAGILNDPFYKFNRNSSLNYGGIGGVIAHEISHAFDNNGAQFDEFGNLNNWWTEKDKAGFDAKIKQAIELFDQVPTKHGLCNGLLTVSENIADIGGFACAYEAAKTEKDFNAKNFFYSWATIWRAKYRPELAKARLKSDVHAPTELRANQQVKNHDAFYEVFGVKPGDPMYLAPEKRVKIW